jgi:hypothetical protein
VFGPFFCLQVFDAITASQQESGTLSLDFFRNHASPSWKTDDLVTEKSMDVDDKAKAENSLPEHDLPTNRSPKDPGTNISMNIKTYYCSSAYVSQKIKCFFFNADEHQVDKAAKVARRVTVLSLYTNYLVLVSVGVGTHFVRPFYLPVYCRNLGRKGVRRELWIWFIKMMKHVLSWRMPLLSDQKLSILLCLENTAYGEKRMRTRIQTLQLG